MAEAKSFSLVDAKPAGQTRILIYEPAKKE
jgi:hypothetical protein